jgi:hypothetical protein
LYGDRIITSNSEFSAFQEISKGVDFSFKWKITEKAFVRSFKVEKRTKKERDVVPLVS